MLNFKERPEMDKPKTKLTTIPSKQAAHILKEKYRRQLDQHPEESENETTNAVDEVESSGQQAVSRAMSLSPRSGHGQTSNKQRGSKEAPALKRGKRKSRQSNPLKTKAAQEQDISRQRTTLPSSTPKQETASPSGLTQPQKAGRKAFVLQQKERRPMPLGPSVQAQNVNKTATPREIGPKISKPRQPNYPKGELSTSSGNVMTRPLKLSILKDRPRTMLKRRARASVKTPGLIFKAKVATNAVEQTVQRRMRQQAVVKAKRAAKAVATMGQKVAIAITKAMTALGGSLVGLLGGGVLLAIFIFIATIAAIANSPFGIFFSGSGGTGGHSVPTVSVPEAVGSINMEYNTKLAQLQSGSYDSITLAGQAADWPDVLATFAARHAASNDGVDVVTLDADRLSKLTATFWDMTDISSEVESIHHADSDPDDDVDDSWTEHILHITVTPKTAEAMKSAYSFTDYQISALDELLADPAALASLAGSLEIANANVRAVLNTLPEDLSVDRKRAVETALQLVGKVNYFWGGKSYVIGWDSRWGRLTKVTADGSPSTGTYRPYGLDCTGFIDWTLRNAGLPSDGHWYVGTNLTEVTQANAMPGDIALYPDNSHVGMVVGRNSSGKLLICHCSSGHNNVVVTEYTTSGFTALGRPGIYSQ